MQELAPNPALSAIQRSLLDAVKVRTAAQVLARNALTAHFQPIVQLRSGEIVAHEALARGPSDSPLQTPDALFAAARAESLSDELEEKCIRQAIKCWAPQQLGSRLFLNLSARALVAIVETNSIHGLLQALQAASVSPASLVIEITEHEQVADMPRLIAAADGLRARGLRFALDDFGEGRSSLRLWAELRPEYVKIDKYFIHELDANAVKVQTLRGIRRFAETFNTLLVAEGIETAGELQAVRDLGIDFGQGYFLGRPAALAARAISEAGGLVIQSARVAVLPEMARTTGPEFTVGRLCVPVPPIDPMRTVDEVAKLFATDPTLRAVALVEGDRPVGLLNRQTFVDGYARPYFKELYGRKPCLQLANKDPLLLEKHVGLEGMTAVLTSPDQRYLTEGFIVVDGGRYAGIGTGEQLVRVVTEVRIEAARHANPLTFLPGNIPISEHIERLLHGRAPFVACYADLNNFKPFNDHYGYWRGDEMIRLVARTILSHCDAKQDFVGHVGGDDFVILFQSENWEARCRQIISSFGEEAKQLFDADAVENGGIDAEDRYGVMRFFPLTSLSIGAVPIAAGAFAKPEQVASAAALAKHKAKQERLGLSIEATATAAVREQDGSTLPFETDIHSLGYG